MSPAQEQWLRDNPSFALIGPPRPVQFSQWGTLYADGRYERLDDKPRTPITVGNGAIGVAVIKEPVDA